MPLHVLGFMLLLGKFHRGGQFGPGSDACRVVTLVVDWPSDMGRGSDRHVATLHPDLSIDAPGNNGFAIHEQQIAPQLAVDSHGLRERRKASVYFASGIEVYHLIEHQDVLANSPRNSQVIRS